MVNETTNNKNYPLPHPSNIASQDVTRIATALTMIDADISECSSSINSINNTVQNLDAKSLRIPSELVGQVNTELTNIQPRRYVVVNEDASGFSTVEGGGGEGGKKGEILVKKSDANFDTTWLDPRAILKKAPTVKEVVSDVQLQNNGTTILAEVQETDLRDDTPRHGLTQRQITSDTTADSSYTYILCDTIDDTAEDESDIATHEKFGRVKIGSGINVNNGEISVPVIGVASENNFGLVKIGSGLNVNNGVVSAQTYPHADHENFGIIKPSEDFNFDSNGALQVAKKSEDIIYQKAAKNIVEDGVIKIVPTCAYYRAFITNDMLFSFDLSDFTPKADFSFDLEIVSNGNYIVNFGNNIAWENPCAAVTVGTTLIHFEKMLGNSIMIGNLISTGTPPLTKILNDSNLIDDVSDICICKHNGTSRGDREAYDLGVGRNFWHNYMFTNPEGGIFEFDLLKSTYVPYAHFDLDGGTLAYFYVEGSVDGNNWRRLLTLTNVSTSGDNVLDSCGFFRYYRILTKGAYFLNLRLIGYSIDDNLFELKKLIPSMTSNEENGYAITSTTLNSGALSNLTGVSRTSYADFTTRDNGEFWIKYELPEAESVDMIDLMASADSSEKMPNWFKIEGSNNDSDWTLLIERAYLTRWYEGESRQYWINNSTAYKYYKFTPIETSSSGFRIARFRLYKKIDGILSSKSFIPSLTSTSQGGYEVSASSQYNGDHSVLYAFDGNTSTRWATVDGDTVGGWIQVKFPTETLCTAAWLTARNDSSYDQAPSAFKILGSIDGENFETIKTISDQEWTQGEQKIFDFYNTIPYLYYRIEAVTIQDEGSYFGLSEVNFGTRVREYKRVLNTYRKLTPIMTANSQDGFVVTASDTYSGGRVYFPYLSFNNVISDSESWTVRAQSGWIQIELPEADKANVLRMSGGFTNEEPDSFVLYGSNDGENYDELLNSGALTWTHNETKTWSLENNTAYKFYKIEAVNTKKNFITISEIQLIEQVTTREY